MPRYELYAACFPPTISLCSKYLSSIPPHEKNQEERNHCFKLHILDQKKTTIVERYFREMNIKFQVFDVRFFTGSLRATVVEETSKRKWKIKNGNQSGCPQVYVCLFHIKPQKSSYLVLWTWFDVNDKTWSVPFFLFPLLPISLLFNENSASASNKDKFNLNTSDYAWKPKSRGGKFIKSTCLVCERKFNPPFTRILKFMINFHKNSRCSFFSHLDLYDEFIVKIRSARYKFVMYAMSIFFFLLCRMCLEYNRREAKKKLAVFSWIDGNITFEIFTHSTRENVETGFELIFQEYPGRIFHVR